MRFTFGIPELSDGVELVALAMGLFGVADFLRNVNRMQSYGTEAKVRLRDMRPEQGRAEAGVHADGARHAGRHAVRRHARHRPDDHHLHRLRARDARSRKTPERFGHGAIAGVAAPEAPSHSKTQVDFIPTMSLGIPGDAVMALMLGALLIQGIQPGPQLITEHADLFWGLIASFWVGNVLLVILNVPMIGVWVKLLQVPYRFLFPSALFFIAIGVYSTNNSLFEVGEVLVFGIMRRGLAGAAISRWRRSCWAIVLGPMVEENFRRATAAVARRSDGVSSTPDQRGLCRRLCPTDRDADRLRDTSPNAPWLAARRPAHVSRCYKRQRFGTLSVLPSGWVRTVVAVGRLLWRSRSPRFRNRTFATNFSYVGWTTYCERQDCLSI